VPFALVVSAILPLALFVWISSSVLKKSIKTTVVNEPQAALNQSLNNLSGSYDKEYSRNLLNALHFASKDGLKKVLSGPVTSVKNLKNLCEAELSENPASLFVLVDKNGWILYDNLGIPKPAPSSTPAGTLKRSKNPSKTKGPQWASAKDWPGMDGALAGSKRGGLLTVQGSIFLVLLVPVESKDKILGVVAAGSKIDEPLLSIFKNSTLNDIAFYSQAQTWCTGSLPAPKIKYLDYLKLKGPSPTSSLAWGPVTFLAKGLPLLGLDQEPAAYLAVFQPVKQNQTVEGTPQKSLIKTGILFLFLIMVLVGAFSWFYVASFEVLFKSIDNISRGDMEAPIPQDPFTEWGLIGGALHDMRERLKEKERVSLILGKVVDPQAAKKILAEKDYFSLKGEKRECTLLQADLKGFNTLSENMSPEILVDALNQYFSVINEVVFKYEGMLDKFIGETAIAVWGAPFTHSDKESRAIRTALEIQEALKNFNISRIKKGFPPFTVGIGIHTGAIVSGNLGSNKRYDYSIIGEPLHLVGRLCAMAAPGQIVVSEETYIKIKSDVKATPLNPMAQKGSMEPLKTFEISQWL